MENKHELRYTLRFWMLITIFVVYICAMIFGGVVIVFILCCYDFKTHIMLYTIYASFSSALCTCAMQYTKRLYKACIYKRVELGEEKNRMECIGNFIYFLVRPLFALAFVIIFILAVKAGIIVILDNKNWIENDRFLYVCAVASSLIGFSVGKVLDMFQEISYKNVDKVKGEKVG